MFRLITLGRLELVGSGFLEQKPLLLLAYLALKFPTLRHEVTELFWGGPNKGLMELTKSLETGLGTLRRVDRNSIVLPARGMISTDVVADVGELCEVLEAADLEQVEQRCQGPFLEPVEKNSRQRLPGGSVEWTISKRAELQDLMQKATSKGGPA